MLTAAPVIEKLHQLGVTHVVGIPDNASAELYRELEGRAGIRVLTVTREGEAFAIAAGLWIGGRVPLVLIQNTGLLESGDSLRGTLVRMKIPVLTLISCRGYSGLPVRCRAHLPSPPAIEDLSDPAIDSVALVTEPTLRSWGVPCWKLAEEGDLERFDEARRWAEARRHPVALLLETAVVGSARP